MRIPFAHSSASEGSLKPTRSQTAGVHIVAEVASEMIGESALLMEKNGSAKTLAYLSHGHPTLSEAIKEAALSAIGRSLHG